MKRRLLIAAMVLLAGAVVNVAVAWGLAVSVDLHLMEPFVSGSTTVPTFSRDSASTQFDGWKLWQRSAPGFRMVAIAPEKSSMPRDSASPDALPAGTAPAYRRLCAYTDRPVNKPPGTWMNLIDQARGWPMLALCCQQEYNSYGGGGERVRHLSPTASRS